MFLIYIVTGRQMDEQTDREEREDDNEEGWSQIKLKCDHSLGYSLV